MGRVTVPVNGRSYTVSCEDGQETRIRRLAQYVDAKLGEFVAEIGQVGEARLLLLTALVIADELSDANDALEQERSQNRPTATNPNGARSMAGRAQPIAADPPTP